MTSPFWPPKQLPVRRLQEGGLMRLAWLATNRDLAPRDPWSSLPSTIPSGFRLCLFHRPIEPHGGVQRVGPARVTDANRFDQSHSLGIRLSVSSKKPQYFWTELICTRSSGECAPYMFGPNEIICISG